VDRHRDPGTIEGHMSSVPPPNPAPNPPSETARLPDEPPEAARSRSEPPWRLWMAPAGVLLGLAAGLVATIIVEIAGQAGGSRVSHPTPAVSIIGDIVFDLSFVGAAIYLTALVRRPRPADFGFRTAPLRRAVIVVVIGAVGYYLVTLAYAAAVNIHTSDKLPSELGVSHSTAALVAATVFVCVIAPVCEEFFFRGFLFGVLRRMHIEFAGRELGPWVAAVITGTLFGLAHAGSAAAEYLLPLAFLGFVLCLIRWKTGSLYPCMALHSANNALALGVNQEHWSALAIFALTLGSWLVIAALTGPLSQGRLRVARS
jgi:membrane protease YdiL (CAAX protease family)